MKLSKFLATVFWVTCISLLYVHQQTEVFRLAYVGGKKQALFQELLDKNNILRYNIGSSASLVQIASKISKTTDFQMPDTYRLVRLTPSSEGLRFVEQPVKKETILSRIFGIKRQAEAKTVP
jgi:hypothetical protein